MTGETAKPARLGSHRDAEENGTKSTSEMMDGRKRGKEGDGGEGGEVRAKKARAGVGEIDYGTAVGKTEENGTRVEASEIASAAAAFLAMNRE